MSQLPALKTNVSVTRSYEEAVLSLLMKKAFLAKLILSMRKNFNFPLPTAAVQIESKGITLHLNADFFNGLSHEERVAILEHECLHVIHNHSSRFKDFKSEDRGVANVACDVAINQFIPNLPKVINVKLPNGEYAKGKPVFFEDLAKDMPGLLPHQSSEYYFNRLKEEQQKRKDRGEGPKEYELTDDHSEWDNSDLTEEQQQEFVKRHVKAVYDSCSDEEKQMVDQTLIEKLFASEIDWKAQLRAFMANSEEIFNESTRRKRNRRYGLLQPGSRTEAKLKLCIPVDTSGSMSDEALNKVFGEIDRICNDNTVIYVIEADCRIHNVYEYKKGMKITAYGRGGTAYQPAFDKCKELGADAIIYCGDMDSSDIPKKPKCPVLWAIVGRQNPPANFGRKIYIE